MRIIGYAQQLACGCTSEFTEDETCWFASGSSVSLANQSVHSQYISAPGLTLSSPHVLLISAQKECTAMKWLEPKSSIAAMREGWIQHWTAPLFIDIQFKADLGGQGYLLLGSSFSGVLRAELTPYGARLNFRAQETATWGVDPPGQV